MPRPKGQPTLFNEARPVRSGPFERPAIEPEYDEREREILDTLRCAGPSTPDELRAFLGDDMSGLQSLILRGIVIDRTTKPGADGRHRPVWEIAR